MKQTFAMILILTLLVVAPCCVILAGCRDLVNTEYETVQVEIIDQNYSPAYRVPMMVGKVMTFRTIPASYRITVKYCGVEYTVDGSDTYHEYKDMIGLTVPATLRKLIYDDGTVKSDIIALGEENHNGM